ncbi:hypothetical protein [Paracoccus sp. S-4012]|uniref:hypothetical protein n=1 Tax=Paracoccus sp. S-4012 TaxID=2665648 RepID=UPI0018A1DAC9|nr:hypothetical protein [Paracoccus sp. S-4012]
MTRTIHPPRRRARTVLGCAVLAASTALAGCADQSDQIAPSYVSPSMFTAMNCQQLGDEAHRVSSRASHAIAEQDRRASNDATATAISLILFWPAAFFIKGDGQSAAEVARLKGEMQAIEHANTARNCGIQFQTGA